MPLSGTTQLPTGLYSQQIQRYFDIFGEEQVIVLLFEELKENPKFTVEKVSRFLGVDEAFAPRIDVHNRGCVPYSVPLQFFLKQHLGRYLHRSHLPRSQQVVSRLLRLNTRSGPPPHIDVELRRALAEQYAENIKKTSVLIKRDLIHWLKECPD